MAKISLLTRLLNATGAEIIPAVDAAGKTVGVRLSDLAAPLIAAAGSYAKPVVAGPRGEIIDDRAGLLGDGPALYVSPSYFYRRGALVAGNAGGIDMPGSDEMVGYAKLPIPLVSPSVTALIYRQSSNKFELIPFADGDLVLPDDGIVDVLAMLWDDAIHSRLSVRRSGDMMGTNQCYFGRTMRLMPHLFLAPAFRTERDPRLLALGLTESYAPAGNAAFAGDDFAPADQGRRAVIAYTLTSDQAGVFGLPIVYFRDAFGTVLGSVNPALVARIGDKARRYSTGLFTIPAGTAYYFAGTEQVAVGARAGVIGVQHHVVKPGRTVVGISRDDFPPAPPHNGAAIIGVLGQSNAITWVAGGPDQVIDQQDARVLQQLPFGLGPETADAIGPGSWDSPNGNMVVTSDDGVTVLTANGADPTYPAARFRLAGLAAGKYRVELEVACASGVPAALRDDPQTGVAYAFSPVARTSTFDITVGAGGTAALFLIGDGGPATSPAGTAWRVSRTSVRAIQNAGTAIVAAAEPLAWRNPADTGAWNTSPVYHAAKRLVDLDPTLKRVVVLPTAQGGTSLVGGPWNLDGGALYLNLIAQLTAALAACPGAAVKIYVAQGEADAMAGVAPATYQAALQRAIEGVRAVPGAENARVVIVSMVPEWVADAAAPAGQTRQGIHAAHRALAAALPEVDFLHGVRGLASPGDTIHYSPEAARRNGRAAGALLAGPG